MKKAIRSPWSTGILIGLSALLATAPRAGAQVDQGTITGEVRDSTGALIPNAQITLTDTDTNLVLQSTSDRFGNYVFSPLKIGHYKVAASAPGFSTSTQENLQIDAQSRLNVVLVLRVGQATQDIVVSTAPPFNSE